MEAKSMLWRRLDQPGHEATRLTFQGSSWHLAGTAAFVHSDKPCRLDYLVICDLEWHTLGGNVSGWVGDNTVEVEIAVDSNHRWLLSGKEYPEVEGCIDLDLAFSPSTNLLPIRRLGLAIGEEAEARAAWLRFPDFALEPLDQIYRRISEAAYHYESAGGSFVAELQVNAAGFITCYSGLWQVEASA
jgi:hypothetical protein